MSAVSHNKTLTMADFTGTVTVFNSTGGAISIAATDIWGSSNGNSAPGQFVRLSGNTSNLSTAAAVSNIVLAGGNNVTLSMATAAGVASITISQRVPVLSRYTEWGAGAGQGSLSASHGSAYARAFKIEDDITFSRVDLPVFVSLSGSTSQITLAVAISSALVLYSNNAGTLSPIAGLTSQTTFSCASNTSNFANFSVARYGSFGVATSLSRGEYCVGWSSSTATSSVGTATTSAANQFQVSWLVGIITGTGTSGFTDFGNVLPVSSNLFFAGNFSNSLTATNQTLAQTDFTVTGSAQAVANVPIMFRNG